ncbi:MAG: F0F1 ATP synthase subunit A [Verrucomicrobiales bacterium]
MFASSTALLKTFELPLLAEVSIKALPLSGGEVGAITNSVLVAVIVTALILWFVRRAMLRPALVPGQRQNLVEMVVEFLYIQIENVVGKKVAPKAFPLLATIFIYVLTANWFGLLPGVGTFGLGPTDGFLTIAPHAHVEEAAEHAPQHGSPHAHRYQTFIPLLRPATADLNMTLGLALVFMAFWVWITLKEGGLWNFIKHTFGPKGGVTGLLGVFMIIIFLGVGVIELISIAIRPVSLSLRLFGNIFAGETLMHAMASLGEMLNFPAWLAFIMKTLLPVPFFFMELLVGAVQALVFMLLCSVYIQLSTTHEDEAHH